MHQQGENTMNRTKKQRNMYFSEECWVRLTTLAERAKTDRSNFIELAIENILYESIVAEERKNNNGVPNEKTLEELKGLI